MLLRGRGLRQLQHLAMDHCSWRSSLRDLDILKCRSLATGTATLYICMSETARFSGAIRRWLVIVCRSMFPLLYVYRFIYVVKMSVHVYPTSLGVIEVKTLPLWYTASYFKWPDGCYWKISMFYTLLLWSITLIAIILVNRQSPLILSPYSWYA